MELLDDERLDDLQRGGLKIIQKRQGFRFGTDAVLLADFASPRPGEQVVDFGTGTGILPLLMAARQPRSTFDALEIQRDMADMAARSVRLNGLEARIRVHCEDLALAPQLLGRQKYDLVVCNPPYGRMGTVLLSERQDQRTARHEGACTLEGIAQSAAALLRFGGRAAFIYPAPRALELMRALSDQNLEPKRIRTVHSFAGRAPKLVLLDAVKGGGSMLHWMEPLILSEADGSPTAEWRRIYGLE
jgi:tRNA1Val (adenine37-N6)-methyltransferase